MYICRKSLAAALLLAVPTTATASTITYNGKTYEEASNYGTSLSAQVGQSVTKSFAYAILFAPVTDFGPAGINSSYYQATETAFYDIAVANGSTQYSVETLVSSDFSLSSTNYATGTRFDTTGMVGTTHQFSVIDYASINQSGYIFFDLTFAPTTATPSQSTGFLDSYIDVQTYDLDSSGVATHLDSDAYIDTAFIDFNVLPTTPSVTPVPVPGSAAFLALGLMGLAVAKRKKT